MKALKIFLAVILLFLLERLVFVRFEIFSLTPWLGFSFCLVGAVFAREDNSAVITALIYGLVSDFSGGGMAGTATFAFGLTAVLVKLASMRFFGNNLLSALFLVLISGLLGECLYFILNSRNIGVDFGGLFVSVIFPLSLINTACGLILYPLAKRIFAKRRAI